MHALHNASKDGFGGSLKLAIPQVIPKQEQYGVLRHRIYTKEYMQKSLITCAIQPVMMSENGTGGY